MSWFNNLKIGTRILGGFIIVVSLTMVAGVTGIVSVGSIGDAVERISYEEAPLVDAAMEMKINIATAMNAMEEYKGATSTMASDDESIIKGLEEKFNQTVINFDVFVDAILLGGETEGGEIRATDNDELRVLVEEADQLHNEKFQLATSDLFTAGKDLLKQKEIVNESMELMESIYDEIAMDAGNVEKIVKEMITAKKNNLSTNARRLIERDIPLTDMAMEIKTTLAMSRIRLEEINQQTDESSITGLQNEFAQTIEEFDLWVTAILEGAETDEGRVYASTDEEILTMVKELDLDHADFQEAADVLIKGQLEMVRLNTVANEAMVRLDQYGDEVANLLDQVEEESSGEMDDAVLSADASKAMANITLISVTIISVLAGILIGLFINRGITNPINKVVDMVKDMAQGEGDLTVRLDVDSKDELGDLAKWFNTFVEKLQDMIQKVKGSSEQIGNASGEITSASEELATGAEEQQAQLGEVATSIEQMSAMILQASKNAGETKQNAIQTTEAANNGQKNVANTINGMEGVAGIVDNASSQISGLEQRSNEIGEVIQVIDDIADQTNLLALNANIEAARAGEAGRGFAVVADEVRKLAERTVTATGDIGEQIQQIQTDVGEAVEAMTKITTETSNGQTLAGESGEALSSIVDMIAQVDEAVAQIAAGADEQSSGAEEISKNVESVSTVSKQAASSSQELSASAQQLNSEVEGLNELINQFKV